MRAICMLVAILGIRLATGAESPPPATPQTSAKVYVLPLEGPIDKSLLFIFRRAFREANAVKPAAVIIELNTPGGGLRETKEIINWIRSVKQDTPVYAYVNSEALSAGAIISLGCTAIFMSPAGTIGSAMPIAISPTGGVQELPPDIQEKMLSAVRAMVRGLAQENGYSEEIAVAMVDPDTEVIVGEEVVCEKGKLLNLPARSAVQIIPPRTTPLLAQAIVDDIDGLLDHVDLPGATVIRFEEQGAERLARWITAIGPLLLALGALLLYIEIRTPGFGIPGLSGIVCLAIYFFGHYVAGLAGHWDLVLLAIGIILLGVEVFVIPGFGVTGIAGIFCILLGSFMALIPSIPGNVPPLQDVEPLQFYDYVQDAMRSFTLTMILVAIGIWLLSKILPKTSLYGALVCQQNLARDKGYVSSNVDRNQSFLGHEGIAMTPLRPAGIARFGADRLDVLSSGDFIPKGAAVKVIETQGGRVLVEQVAGSQTPTQPTPVRTDPPPQTH